MNEGVTVSVRPRASRRMGACAGIAAGLLLIGFHPADVDARQRGVDFSREPACQTLTTTSTGGPAPVNRDVLVMRYLGASNHEIAYRDAVILFNAYYQRFPPGRPLGFTREQVKKADAILVGHAHGDHFADVPFVAKQTGAPVIGAPITAAAALKAGIPEKQIVSVTGRGGEIQRIKGLTIEPLLGTHKENSPEYGKATGAAFRSIMEAMGLARTPEEQARARAEYTGANDPKLGTEGTLGYLITTDNGFRIILRDASGDPTAAEMAAMKKIGRTDVAVVSYTTYVPQPQIPLTMKLVKLFNPAVYMPTHHDDTGGSRLDTPMEPWFLALRDEMPQVRPISPLYRTPVCFDTRTKDVFVGR